VIDSGTSAHDGHRHRACTIARAGAMQRARLGRTAPANGGVLIDRAVPAAEIDDFVSSLARLFSGVANSNESSKNHAPSGRSSGKTRRWVSRAIGAREQCSAHRFSR
jgi:hypothetical protein